MTEILLAICAVTQAASTALLVRHAILEKKTRRQRAARTLPYGL